MEPNGPAERSGLRVGDIILEFNKRKIATSSDLPYVVGPIRSGTVVPVKILRKGKRTTIDVTVGTRNTSGGSVAAAEPAPAETRLGILVEEMTAEMKQKMGVDGLIIKQVSANSPAAEAGLEPGDILVQLGFDEINTIKAFKKIERALPANKPQPVRVIRRGAPLFRSITINK